jgi:hypothetical protein
MKSQLFPSRGMFRSLRTAHPIAASSRALAAGLAVTTLALSLPVSLHAQEEAGEGDRVVAVVKAPPARQLSEKILAVARKIQPGPQTEALPFILGGMLGDPMLQGISGTESIGVALLLKDGELVPVFVLNLPQESPLRQSLPQFNLQLRDAHGWTFALPADQSPALLEGQEQAIISAVRVPRRYDIEVSASGTMLGRKLYEGFEEAIAENLDESTRRFARPLVQALAGESESVSDFRAGLNISANLLEQVLLISGAEGSPLAAFLNQKRPENLDFGRFISADGALTYIGGVDVEVMRNYVSHFTNRLSAGGSAETSQWWESFRQMADLFLQSTNGATAGSLTLRGMEVTMTQISPSSMSDEQLVQMLEQTVTALGGIMSTVADGGPGLQPGYELLTNHLQVDGIPVHIFRTEIKLDAPHAEELQRQIPDFALPVQRQDIHYAMAEGYLLASSEAAAISSMIEAVKKGVSAEKNLSSVINVGENDLFELRIDLLRYFGGAMAPFMTPEMAAIMQRLEQQRLAPVRATLSARGGEGEFKLQIPVDTLVTVFQTISGFMGQQQQGPGGLDPFAPAQP